MMHLVESLETRRFLTGTPGMVTSDVMIWAGGTEYSDQDTGAIEVDKPTRYIWIERMAPEGWTPEELFPEVTFTLALANSGPGGPWATAGEDFDAAGVIGPFTIPEGQQRMRLASPVTIIDDEDAEPDEKIRVVMTNSSDARFNPAMAGAAEVTVRDNVAVKEIKVRVLDDEEVENAPINPRYYPRSYGGGFAFNVKITIKGERLNDAEVSQQIKAVTRQWKYDGTPKTRDEILAFFGGSVIAHTDGEYVDDTGWTWKPMQVKTGTNNGVAEHYDKQTLSLPLDNAPYGEGQTTQVALLTEVERNLRLKTKKVGEEPILKSHDWGFGWKNTNIRWPADHNPAPPQDKPACALLWGGRKGMFYGIYGIENAGVLEDQNPD